MLIQSDLTLDSDLNLDSVIGCLPKFEFHVENTTPSREIAQQFEQNPFLPGVIVVENSTMLGMISRHLFVEQMSSFLGREIYLKRPIDCMLSELQATPLQLSENATIVSSADLAINRPRKFAYDPIVVFFATGQICLVDVIDLLAAQSHILKQVNAIAHQKDFELRNSQVHLKQQRQHSDQVTQELAAQQELVERFNQLLEHQQAELLHKTEEVNRLTEQLTEINQILFPENRNVFQSTIEEVMQPLTSLSQVMDIGKIITKQVDAIYSASGTTKYVGERARKLALKAAILVNHFGEQFQEFRHLTSDINELSFQISEVAKRTDDGIWQLKRCVANLAQLARERVAEVQASTRKSIQLEQALAEMKYILDDEYATSVASVKEKVSRLNHELGRGVDRVEMEVAELEKNLHTVKQKG